MNFVWMNRMHYWEERPRGGSHCGHSLCGHCGHSLCCWGCCNDVDEGDGLQNSPPIAAGGPAGLPRAGGRHPGLPAPQLPPKLRLGRPADGGGVVEAGPSTSAVGPPVGLLAAAAPEGNCADRAWLLAPLAGVAAA